MRVSGVLPAAMSPPVPGCSPSVPQVFSPSSFELHHSVMLVNSPQSYTFPQTCRDWGRESTEKPASGSRVPRVSPGPQTALCKCTHSVNTQ